MADKEPMHKGTGLLGVVQGLRVTANAEAMLPEHLRKYLEEPILVSGWYPERDYYGLIEVLAGSVDPRQVPGGDVWAYFGSVGAQRDLAGHQDNVPRSARTDKQGVYRRMAEVQSGGAAGFFVRVTKLWSMYHDTGRLCCWRTGEDEVTMRLVDFHFPIHGLVTLQSAYLTQYAQLIGFKMRASVLASTAKGAPHCEWLYRVLGPPEALPSLQTLPTEFI